MPVDAPYFDCWRSDHAGRKVDLDMHALGEFIAQQMEQRGWERRTLITRSHLSKQHVSQLLDPRKTSLGGMVDDKTVRGLSEAFDVDETVIITKAAEAMGVPVDRLAVVQADPESLSNEALIRLLERRLLEGVSDVGSTRQKMIEGTGGGTAEAEPVPERRGSIRGKLGADEAGPGEDPDPVALEDLAGDRNGNGG